MEINIKELDQSELLDIQGGQLDWGDVWDYAYAGNWYGAIMGAHDIIGG